MLRLLSTAAALLAAAAMAGCGSDSADSKGAAGGAASGERASKSVNVAVWPHMPYVGVAGDGVTATGLDGDILAAVTKKLGYEVKVTSTNLDGALGGVPAGRVDMTMGSIGWTAERAETGVTSDPLYYNPPALVVKSGTKLSTIQDFDGKTIGAKNGSLFVPAVKAVPGAKLRVYPDDRAGIADVTAGRIQGFFTDALVGPYAQKSNADLDIDVSYLQRPSEAEMKAQPDFRAFTPYQAIFYAGAGQDRLIDDLNGAIDELYSSGELAKLVEKWGGDPEVMLHAPPEATEQRAGVDRPDDWKAPSL